MVMRSDINKTHIILMIVLSSILICEMNWPAVAARDIVEQWGIFELALNGPALGNPFLDVRFTSRFFRDGSAFDIPGFYDGDGLYRVRFMPDKPGRWRYITSSNVSGLDGKSGEFIAMKPSGKNRGPKPMLVMVLIPR